MSFPNILKKSAVACTLVAPIMLVACSSGDSNNEAAATSTGVISAEKTTAKTTSGNTSTENTSASKAPETTSQTQAASSEPAGEPDSNESVADAAAASNPIFTEELKPVNGGPADEATIGEISALVGGWYEVPNLREFVRYIPSNTCVRTLESHPDVNNVDYDVLPLVPMSQVNSKWNNAGIESVEDVFVDGDEASATVTSNTGEGLDTSVMRFKHEGGRWLFCGDE